MRKAKQTPAQPSMDIGAELLTSIREMKAGIRAQAHHPEVSEVVRARLTAGLSKSAFAVLLVRRKISYRLQSLKSKLGPFLLLFAFGLT